MTDELKSLIEDAAKLLGLPEGEWFDNYDADHVCCQSFVVGDTLFDPLDPERGDLMKVARAGWMTIRHENGTIDAPIFNSSGFFKHLYNDYFDTDDYQSLALAILRAASAVYRARNESDLLP